MPHIQCPDCHAQIEVVILAEKKPDPIPQKPSLEILHQEIDYGDFSTRSANILYCLDIRHNYELAEFSSDEILRVKGIGRKTYNEINEYLLTKGLWLDHNAWKDIPRLRSQNPRESFLERPMWPGLFKASENRS